MGVDVTPPRLRQTSPDDCGRRRERGHEKDNHTGSTGCHVDGCPLRDRVVIVVIVL